MKSSDQTKCYPEVPVSTRQQFRVNHCSMLPFMELDLLSFTIQSNSVSKNYCCESSDCKSSICKSTTV